MVGCDGGEHGAGGGGEVGPRAVQLWIIFYDVLMVSYRLGELSSFQ